MSDANPSALRILAENLIASRPGGERLHAFRRLAEHLAATSPDRTALLERFQRATAPKPYQPKPPAPRAPEVLPPEVGATVTWTSNPGSPAYRREHSGQVVAIVPRGANARALLPAGASWRLRAGQVVRSKVRVLIGVVEGGAGFFYAIEPKPNSEGAKS